MWVLKTFVEIFIAKELVQKVFEFYTTDSRYEYIRIPVCKQWHTNMNIVSHTPMQKVIWKEIMKFFRRIVS